MDFRGINEFIKDTFKYILVIVIVLVIVLYVISFQQVMGPSMEPTLNENDVILVNKITYHFNKLKRFDVVVLKHKEKVFIKRIIGLPGEHIEYINNILYVDEKKVEENFKFSKIDDFKMEEIGYTIIPRGMYLVIGDNRENSEDSREFGLIEKEDIIGKAAVTIWPLNSIGFIK